ncbi:MAG: hypothetical protein ACYCWE_22020 [Eubacteriales bacterium]
MKNIIFITILSIFLLAGCSGTEISSEITIKETEPTFAEVEISSETAAETTIPEAEPAPVIEIVMAIPADIDQNDLSSKIASDFNTALLSTPQSWTMMPLDGGIITDDFILQTAFTAYEIYKETEAEIIKDEKGLYMSIDIMQKTVDLLFADPPEIDTYTFGSLYRNNAKYTDCIFMPFEFYEKFKYYEDKYKFEYNSFRYNAETNHITCAINFNKFDEDGNFAGIDCRKEFSLSSLIINGKTYYRFNEILEYGVYNIQPDQLTDTITDYRDWEQLGLNKTELRYLFIKAFVNGDTETLEYMANADKGVYDSYKSIVLGNYTIKRSDKSPISPLNQNIDGFIIFDFDILSSENEVLCTGHHSLLIEYTLCMQMIDYADYVMFPILTEAQKSIYYYHGTSFPDFKAKTNNGNYNISTEYILVRLNYLSGNYKPRSAEDIIAYAKKYFDVDDYKINEDEVYKTQNGYEVIGRGAASPSYNFVSEEIRDGITVVTVQFWADFSQTVKSVLIEFYLEPLDGDFKPLYSTILEDTGYKTSWISN